MIIRIADLIADALQIMEAAHDFIDRMDFTAFFPKDERQLVDAVSRIVMADFVETLIAEHEGKIVGILGMTYLPHLWNQDLIHAEEIFWWGAKNAPKTTGMRLLKFARKQAEKHGAGMITFRMMTSSPKKLSRIYNKMGLVEIETTYSGAV